MKKRIGLCLACLLMLLCALVLISCQEEDHTHTYAEEWSFDDEGHWHTATCAHTSKKSDYGKHKWDKGTVIEEPTEKREGLMSYACTVCGKTKEEAINPLEHVHTFESVLSFDENGHYYAATCSHTTERKGYTAHQYNATVTNPTCTEGGYTTNTCVCGHSYVDTPVGAHGHDYQIWTPNGDGTHTGTCIYDATHTTEEGCEAASEAVTDPTCTENGFTTYTCKCGHTWTGNVQDAHGHDYGNWTPNGDGTHTGTCTYDEAHILNEDCVAVSQAVTPPTCDADGFTTYTCKCGHTWTGNVQGAHGHNYGSWTPNGNGTHKGTCTYDGAHTVNEACVAVSREEKEATCAADGGTLCTCSCSYTWLENVQSAFGHNYINWTSDGAGKHTATCANNPEHVLTENCSAKTSVVTPPTCHSEGYTTHTCVCGHTWTGNVQAAVDHCFGEDGKCLWCNDVRMVFLSLTGGGLADVQANEDLYYVTVVKETDNSAQWLEVVNLLPVHHTSVMCITAKDGYVLDATTVRGVTYADGTPLSERSYSVRYYNGTLLISWSDFSLPA